eukprot:6197577-Pleurochrysis_carterae.AAC.2
MLKLDPAVYEPTFARRCATGAAGNSSIRADAITTSRIKQQTPPTTALHVETEALPHHLSNADKPAIKT